MTTTPNPQPVRPNLPQKSKKVVNVPVQQNSKSVPTKQTVVERPVKKGASNQSFHNPYNFVPAIPRQQVAGDLGDSVPSAHGRYLPDRWSGEITLQIQTITPLLIIDAAQGQKINAEHQAYPMRQCHDGLPYLTPTSIKGMLRTAYEIVTNSRLSQFSKHEEPLVYRMAASSSNIYPAVVRKIKGGKNILRIMPAHGVMGHVSRLPSYKKDSEEKDKGESMASLVYHESGELPQHGDLVWVKLNPDPNSDSNYMHLPEDIREYFMDKKLLSNVVIAIQRRNSEIPPDQKFDKKWRKGVVCVTGANVKDKRYERVFLENDEDDKKIVITPAMEKMWRDLVLDYKMVNKTSLKKRREDESKPEPYDYLGDKPGETAFSWHVYESLSEDLKSGTLCYVELDRELELNNDFRVKEENIKAILPVTLSRHFYDVSPASLLDKSLQPAQDFNELSPADRVFGWVKQGGHSAYRGNIRIHSVQCLTKDAIKDLSPGLPLAILGQPRPQQGRFYAAKDQEGTPIDRGTAKEKMYQAGQGLRGRKVYPHHAGLPTEYWDNPLVDRTNENHQGFFQECRRPQKERAEQQDNQNRSITEWVKPNVEFECKISVTNLSEVELGALLWLLDLPENSYFRLGGGKPLGFGSVRLQRQSTELRNGKDWAKFYGSLCQSVPIPEQDSLIKRCIIEEFKPAVESAYGQGFESNPFISAFLKAAAGFSQPIHYPRTTQAPQAEGESFKWFVENERRADRQNALGPLADDPGLPIWE